MGIRLYNTMSQKKEEFAPLRAGEAGMYACGVTVYDHCHIGHARAAVAFDVIRRHLAFSGYRVTYVRNYTDIDDKIINRAAETGKDWKEVAETFIAAHDEDMGALLVRPGDLQPRATAHIQGIIAIVRTLVEKGFAYRSEGDVYFEVRKFPGYGKLSHRNIEELEAGARVAVGEKKRDPLDFALWKASKPGEPWWESPWGRGRPGWHIECSAMSSALLGETFDIHGGGMDLIFPHHENEIAQSEAANGKTFARYFLHNGFVNINNEKMSKSLGNFFTIREVLEKFPPEVVRFFLLSTHYRSPLDFSDAALSDARVSLTRFANLFARLSRFPRETRTPSEVEGRALDVLSTQVEPAFREAMDDDFNTAGAIGHLFTGLPALNAAADAADAAAGGLSASWLDAVDAYFRRLGGVLGLFEDGLAWGARFLGGGETADAEVLRLVTERTMARKNKDFARADAIRDQLAALGFTVQDTPQGPVPVPLKK
jgi:cysteinyl-tRNA synthetase